MSEELLKEFYHDLPKNIMDEIESISSKMKLSESKKQKLIEEIKKEFYKNLLEPGEAIGIISAQSISEPATQMTMRTYHFAASAGIQVTLGLPRLIEIFDARKEPTTPMMILYLPPKYNTKEKAEEIAKYIREKRVKYYVDMISIDLTNKRIKIDLKNAKASEIEEIKTKLEKTLKNFNIKVSTKTFIIESKSQDLSIKDLEKLKKKILALHVTGVQNIKNSIVVKEGNDWVIKTLGSNLEKIFMIEGIDFKRSYTNNIHEIANVLGIEAARTILIKEINDTVKQQGLNIDERHISLVADIMTLTGEVKAVGRYGIAGMHSSVLARAGFEETIKHLVKASIRNEVDNFDGIFDNVMINQQVPIGTGMFELIAKTGED